MPHRTNRERLSPGPAPNLPPWHHLATRDLAEWLGVSLQAIYVWQIRRTGPKRTMTRKGRAQYRLADVQFWLDGPASLPPEERTRAFLQANERRAALATLDMPTEMAARVRRLLVRLPSLTTAELEELVAALDRARAFGPKPMAAGVSGSAAYG